MPWLSLGGACTKPRSDWVRGGPVWWAYGSPDLNRRMVRNTSYKDWFKGLGGTQE